MGHISELSKSTAFKQNTEYANIMIPLNVFLQFWFFNRFFSDSFKMQKLNFMIPYYPTFS